MKGKKDAACLFVCFGLFESFFFFCLGVFSQVRDGFVFGIGGSCVLVFVMF